MKSLALIRARLEAATPGPWKSDAGNGVGVPIEVIGGDIAKENPGASYQLCEFELGPRGRANCELVAHAPTDIARLLKIIEDIREESSRAKDNGCVITLKCIDEIVEEAFR